MVKTRFLIITGMSGAGKSLVLRVLEDLEFFCVDNLPPSLIPKFAELYQQIEGRLKNVALVVDIRVGSFFTQFTRELADLDRQGFDYEMLFLDCSDEKLIQRYKETRRRHPLAKDGRVSHGINMEREILSKARSFATNIIDTSNMKDAELRQQIIGLFGSEGQESLFNITVVSFGFKYGIPTDADMVFDVRFLPNPFYVEDLRSKSGNDKPVIDYIKQWPVTNCFLLKLHDMLDFLVPEFIKEGKSQVIIAIGCTGGMHRSVFIVNWLADVLKTQGYKVRTEHRDLAKNTVRE